MPSKPQPVPKSDNIFGLDFGSAPVQQTQQAHAGIKPPVAETKKSEPNLFDDIFANDAPSVKPVQQTQPKK